MVYVLIASLVLLMVLGVLIFSPLTIDVEYSFGKLKITFKCLFIRFSVKDLPGNKNGKKSKSTQKPEQNPPRSVLQKIAAARKGYEDTKGILIEVLDLLKNRAELKDLYIRAKYGTGDAAITGMIYGAVWAFVGSVYGLLCRFFRVEFPRLELEPVFSGDKAFEIEAEGIIKTRLVHIITAAIRSIKIYYKHKKEKGAE